MTSARHPPIPILDDVKAAIRAVMDIPADDPMLDDCSLVDDLGADSLDIMEITMRLEQKFHIAIPDSAIRAMTTPMAITRVLADYFDA